MEKKATSKALPSENQLNVVSAVGVEIHEILSERKWSWGGWGGVGVG